MKKSVFYLSQLAIILLLAGCANYQWPTLGGADGSSAQTLPANPRLVERDLSEAILAPVQIYLSTGLRTDIQTEAPEEALEKPN